MIKITMTPDDPRTILVGLSGTVSNRRGLNAVLADRYVEVLVDHFRKRNAEPNKLGGKRTNFWGQIADATSVASVDDSKAVVTVAEDRFAIHLFGGDIVPKAAKALTIPLVAEAHGLRAASYERLMGRKLFTIPGRNALFERTHRGTESVVGQTNVRVKRKTRSLTIPLSARSTIRPVYALTAKVTIPRDEHALPDPKDVAAALQEEADAFLDRQLKKGGPQA
jgi:hypothetical protein